MATPKGTGPSRDASGRFQSKSYSGADAVSFRLDRDALNTLLKGPTGAVAKALARQAIRTDAAAKRLCPVDTGRLRNSITYIVNVDGVGLYADIGSNVEYAAFVELGTSRMAAQPFLRPELALSGAIV